jgi:diacylglycerol kinase (ATP)
VVGAVAAGLKTDGHRLRVIADGTVLADEHRRVLQVAIGNGAYVGGGTELTPDADPTDGQADVLVSFALSALHRVAYAVHLKRGTHDERHDVHVVRATRVSIEGEEFWCNADGELVGPMTTGSWTLLPAAFSMVLPTPTPHDPATTT